MYSIAFDGLIKKLEGFLTSKHNNRYLWAKPSNCYAGGTLHMGSLPPFEVEPQVARGPPLLKVGYMLHMWPPRMLARPMSHEGLT